MENCKVNKSDTINIGDNNIIGSVICNKPSCEGYDVKNLISKHFADKSKGFLVERFISPPVIITFQFKCSIYLQYIAVYCKVGAQKTTGIEILCQSKTCSDYVSLGSGVLNDNKNGFVFHRFDEIVKDKFGEQYLLRTFKPKTYTNLSSVERLQIKIFRTSGTSVPGLGKIEFWGIPRNIKQLIKEDRCCNPKELNYIEVSDVSTPSVDASLGKCTRQSNNSSSNLKCQKSVSIPEEFLDPITFEVMSLPVIMPSGKIIDNTTLESYEKAERFWGRSPNDPFTGVPFTDSKKPVAATDLKVRIDRYLSNNSNFTELFNIPRTVGSLHSNLRHQSKSTAGVSKLVKQYSSKSDINCVSTRTILQENDLQAKKRKLDFIDAGSDHKTLKPATFTNSNTCEISNLTKKSNSFQERMEKSLEIALRSTLSQLPNLTANKQQIEKTIINCSVCKSVSSLFSIPCNHYICRDCLISVNHKSQMTCLLCNLIYKRSDLNKIHLT